ncbi:MAG: hypothetical protein GX409_01570 [candidate division Zixibacteria bacterium]|nr:hypothetical protein [candidate division Zixibacteria bacterium]
MGLDSKINIYLNSLKSCPIRNKSGQNEPLVGYIRKTPYGDTWIVDWIYRTGRKHGRFPIQKTKRINRYIDTTLPSFNPLLATSIDTETTGLAGGTGTYAFIIGIGFWKNDDFIVRQYLMRDFNEEPAQLYAFAEDLTDHIITFNGKCFDIPLLNNRFKLHRFEKTITDTPHLDMLFPSRRIWKRHLDSFKLTVIEREILGFARVDDIPSHLIPSLFFDYLQTRDETILHPILFHNRDDILSLYQLTITASNLIDQVFDSGCNDDDLILSLAELLFNQCQFRETVELLNKVNPRFASKPTLYRAWQVKAAALKKLKQWDDAIAAYLDSQRLDGRIASLIESAKLFEHKKKQPRLALEMVKRAESCLEFAEIIGEDSGKIKAEIAHRKNRLLKKIYNRR